MTNVLVSSAGRRVALVQALRDGLRALSLDGRILAADSSRLSAAAQVADERYLVPSCDEPTFVPVMLELCRRREVGLLVPTIDPELAVYARHARDFAEVGTLVAVSGPGTVQISADKRETHRFLTEAALPTVQQAEPSVFCGDRTAWPYPFIVKPARGSASQGVVVVLDDDSLRAACRAGDTIAQKLAVGREYTVDVFVDRGGATRLTVPRERLEVRAGEVSKGRTVRLAAVQDLARRVMDELPDAFGVLNVQIFHDPGTGSSQVIEINPRFGGGFPLAHRAGAPFTRWLLELAHGADLSGPVAPWQADLVMLRYDDAVFVDAQDVWP